MERIMEKEKSTLEISGYRDFKCLADKCRYTCCEGWDIEIDPKTYEKWEKSKELLRGVKKEDLDSKKRYLINKETFSKCPFLEEGLCKIVKEKGENYLSEACKTFPRIENDFENKRELSLSLSCEAVLDILDSLKREEIGFKDKEGDFKEEELLNLKIREALIDIIKEEEFPLEERLLIAFDMLLSILEDEIYNSYDALLEEINKYEDKEYKREVASVYKEIEINKSEALEELNALFLDMVENYLRVENLKSLLEPITSFSKQIKLSYLEKSFKDFKEAFKEEELLLEKAIIYKIYTNCVSCDMEEMTLSFQLIILEYLMVRYSAFLKYSISQKNLEKEALKNYIMVFSRLIENNEEGIIDFLEEGFGHSLLEMGYLCFITLF